MEDEAAWPLPPPDGWISARHRRSLYAHAAAAPGAASAAATTQPRPPRRRPYAPQVSAVAPEPELLPDLATEALVGYVSLRLSPEEANELQTQSHGPQQQPQQQQQQQPEREQQAQTARAAVPEPGLAARPRYRSPVPPTMSLGLRMLATTVQAAPQGGRGNKYSSAIGAGGNGSGGDGLASSQASQRPGSALSSLVNCRSRRKRRMPKAAAVVAAAAAAPGASPGRDGGLPPLHPPPPSTPPTNAARPNLFGAIVAASVRSDSGAPVGVLGVAKSPVRTPRPPPVVGARLLLPGGISEADALAILRRDLSLTTSLALAGGATPPQTPPSVPLPSLPGQCSADASVVGAVQPEPLAGTPVADIVAATQLTPYEVRQYFHADALQALVRQSFDRVRRRPTSKHFPVPRSTDEAVTRRKKSRPPPSAVERWQMRVGLIDANREALAPLVPLGMGGVEAGL